MQPLPDVRGLTARKKRPKYFGIYRDNISVAQSWPFLAPAFLHFSVHFSHFWQGPPRKFAKQERKKGGKNGAKMVTLSTYPWRKRKKEARMRFGCRFRHTWCTLGLHGRSLRRRRHRSMLTQVNLTFHRGTKGNKNLHTSM